MFFNRILLCLILVAAETTVDYYELLGISKDADNREIRKAFKKLALQFHPDKNQDKNTHEKFISINKAYEVLKNEETRKKYDQFGEEGLKEDFGNSWKGNYHSWNYYYESFGIYDDDPEIITFSRSDFEQTVLDSSDLWFINFYSPQCSHCHLLAPAWCELARDLKGVIRIGAVNCEEDWALCRRQNVYSYPSLIFYPQMEKYQGPREAEYMMDYVLEKLPYNVIQLTPANFLEQISSEVHSNQPWLIFVCKKFSECFDRSDLKKLGVMLEDLATIAEVRSKDGQLCDLINCESSITYYSSLSDNVPKSERKTVIIDETENIHDISKKVFELLPETASLTDEEFQEIQRNLKNSTSFPWLIRFTNSDDEVFENKMDLKRIKAFLPDVKLGQIGCYKFKATCSSLYIKKYPAFVLFKPGGTYEFHYGRITSYDVARFAREALTSQVHTLTPEHFPDVVKSGEKWFIDFFAPWCPPCMQLLPEWRKASYSADNFVKFGTVDCTAHERLCQQYKINSYPTTILYNQTVPHHYRGAHSRTKIVEFVEDILHPSVLSLSPKTFESNVKENINDVWVIDFYAPWCSPCQQLAPEWRKVAKMLKEKPALHIAEIDCQLHHSFCSSLGVNSYPTIRLYPAGRKSDRHHYIFNGWNRDAESITAWIFQYLPSIVPSLSEVDFEQVLADSEPWLIDFYAPWCGHCTIFAPKFEEISQVLKGKVRTGKINCDQQRNACNRASVRAFPTVLLYTGKKSGRPQNPSGAEEIQSLTPDAIIKFTENRLKIKVSGNQIKDEL